MCCCGCGCFSTPTGGVPIPGYIHDQFSDEVKNAYVIFDSWFKDEENPAKNAMPPEVLEAYELINRTPIPGLDGYTCADSCYMMTVESVFSQNQN